MKIEILEINSTNIDIVQHVAKDAWPAAFTEILTTQQIEYMMQMMYSTESLIRQIDVLNHHYFIAKIDDKPVGYISIEHHCEEGNKTKIHKIYLLPEYQKMGVGHALYKFAMNEAKQNGDVMVYLNVNKHNQKAISFYKRVGFKLTKEEVIDIGNGFVMDDYVFEIDITQMI